MKITAKQVPPECQESPTLLIDFPEMWPGIIITGNRHYNGYTTPEFDAISERWDDEKHILRALHLLTGKRYEKRIIRGNCQVDWQEVYFPVSEYNPKSIQALEIEYFNTGTEWTITSEADPGGFPLYCYGNTMDEIRAEIANCEGVSPENVKLYAFDGYTQAPKYREV